VISPLRRLVVDRMRSRLFRRYVVPVVAVVCWAILVSGALGIWFSYRDDMETLAQLQGEKAASAALRIEHFVRDIERQLAWTTHPQPVTGPAALEQRRIDCYRLLRQAPAVSEVSLLDARGREQLRVSRVAMDVVGGGTDRSGQPVFTQTRGGKTWFGPVYFVKESEPYMTVAVAQSGGGVTVAEVNLKFIWEVVSRIRIGAHGRAYVTDARGRLIAHPDISIVLKQTDLSASDHVRAAMAAAAAGRATTFEMMATHDLQGGRALASSTVIGPLGWIVIVDQPMLEAFAPVRASMLRTGLLMLLGVLVSVAAALFLAGKMVRPLEALRAGAEKIGAGELGHRIDVQTRDELERLADQFNRMAARLQDSYATLEQKVEERTRELSEALDQQTATAEILAVISSSPNDIQPVFDAIVRSAARLCQAAFGGMVRVDGEMVAIGAGHNLTGEQNALMARTFPLRLDQAGAIGEAIRERRVVHVHDFTTVHDPSETGYVFAAAQPLFGYRTILVVPMLREGAAIGALVVWRREVAPFSDTQIAVLQTFADQAVIAIENVRLFRELQTREAALSRSVGELQALGEIGRALNSTLDIERVLATIVSRATQLTGTDAGVIYEYDEAREAFVLRATENFDEALVEILRRGHLGSGEGVSGRAASARAPVQVTDITREGAYASRVRDALIERGFRSLLAVPLLHEDRVLGTLVVNRRTPGEFPGAVVELLRTLATQSALALQNARLFREIEDKSRQLEVASRHKSEFLASVSHELRTPLNAIIGFSEVLLERMFGELNDKQEEYLQDILGSGRHLLSLINDILDLAKIEAGRMELEATEFDLPQAIENALILVRERAARRGVAVGRAVDPRLGRFRGDERKIKQVLLNLLSNAVKFTPEGGRVEVRAEPVNGAVEVSVSDTGVGIAPEDQEAIFEEFRQVGSDHAKKHEGTGLGLSLTRKFVELHGGRIWVKSVPGHGATFTFTLPVRPWPTS
jgi:signal transduction histidine kinase